MDDHIRRVLEATIRILFPVNVDPAVLIKRHVWRNRNYVGEANGKVLAWQGWSANLVAVDFRYRAVFVDVVENALPHAERVRLFGPEFAHAIAHLPRFVVMFVLDFPAQCAAAITEQGFVPRCMGRGRVLHACSVAAVDDFLRRDPLVWAAILARMVILQRVLSIHRRPLDTSEVPLQNLLYNTGFLHWYIVRSGLHLHSLSRPRRAGAFGHDLQAVVTNPIVTPGGFTLGIELYMGPPGYHLDTIPQYIKRFDLRGMIVIAKDDPAPFLVPIAAEHGLNLAIARHLRDVGHAGHLYLHHLPLDSVLVDLASMRDQLDEIIPAVHIPH